MEIPTCKGKECYTREEARRVIKEINTRKRHKKVKGAAMANKTHARKGAVIAYSCRHCRSWHVAGAKN